MGITGHYIDETWTMKSLVLDFVRVQGRHIGEAIADAFASSMEALNIQEKVSAKWLENIPLWL